jgi:hypothetical protein
MKFSIIIIIVIITVGSVFSFINAEHMGFLVQFLVALGLFAIIGVFAVLSWMKNTKS